MFSTLFGFLSGFVVAGVVGFFVVRNNKKTVMQILDGNYFELALDKIEDLSTEVKEKVLEEFNNLKRKL